MSNFLSSHPDDGSAYEVCSIASSTETVDNLPGPGRTLGKLYSHLGSKVENGLGRAAAWMGHNPKGAVSNDQDSLPFSADHHPIHSDPTGGAQYSFQDNDFLYEVCSLTSSAETADDLPGPGRLLGNLYTFIGRKFENRVGSVAVRMGYGPTVSALKIQRIEEDQSLCYSVRRKKLRKNCKLLAQYLRSDVPSTQEQALDCVIKLSVYNDDLRELLNASASRTITSFRKDPISWCISDLSLHIKTRKAITVLTDSRTRYLIDGIFSNSLEEEHTEAVRIELSGHLLNSDLSFLIIRHLCRLSQHVHANILISDFLVFIFKLDEDQTLAFEECLEWEEFDKVVLTVLAVDNFSIPRFTNIIDMVFRHAERLPLSFTRLLSEKWITNLQSNDMDDVARALSRLHTYSEGIQHKRAFFPSLYEHPSVAILRRFLQNPFSLMLALICNRVLSRTYALDNQLVNAYAVLAKGIDSDVVSIRDQAMADVRMALSVNRYTRHDMLAAMSLTNFSQTMKYNALVKETAQFCFPRYQFTIVESLVRHCDEDGKLVHLRSAGENCNGDCGAVEEHILEDLPWEGATKFIVKRGDSFMCGSHYPIISGYTSDGKELYHGQLRFGSRTFGLSIPNGVRPEKISLKRHYSDGSMEVLDNSDSIGPLSVTVLAYDPDTYSLNSMYLSRQSSEADNMNANGPFSWAFSRKLLSRQSLSTSKAKDGKRRLLWTETLIDS